MDEEYSMEIDSDSNRIKLKAPTLDSTITKLKWIIQDCLYFTQLRVITIFIYPHENPLPYENPHPFQSKLIRGRDFSGWIKLQGGGGLVT